jgi:formylmethanofuran dehydrogenase subunit E
MRCGLGKELIDETIAFHGHVCPGLAIGIRAAELALTQLGRHGEADLVAVVETDMCAVDGIQYLTGCTFGKGNLIHRDYGKTAFSFYDRRSNRGFRAVIRPEDQSEVTPDLQVLTAKVADGTATDEEGARYRELQRARYEFYMNADLDGLFSVTAPTSPAPRRARILRSLTCEECGETIMESRARLCDGRILCIPCFAQVEQKT